MGQIWSWERSPPGALSVPAVLQVQLNDFTPPVCSRSGSLSLQTDGLHRQPIAPAQRAARCWGWSSSLAGLLAWWGTPGLLPVEPVGRRFNQLYVMFESKYITLRHYKNRLIYFVHFLKGALQWYNPKERNKLINEIYLV